MEYVGIYVISNRSSNKLTSFKPHLKINYESLMHGIFFPSHCLLITDHLKVAPVVVPIGNQNVPFDGI